jgi:hypothetical protein
MRANTLSLIRHTAGAALAALLSAVGVACADSSVTLTAMPTSTTLSDGQTVPMWGYVCGSVAGDGTVTNTPTNATCTAANGTAQTGGWQPPLIRVPSGGTLTITLNNQLSFAVAGGGTNTVPTSLVIVGQLGGGLGSDPRAAGTQRTDPSPAHPPQGTTWPGTPGTTNPGDPVFTPPAQADRVRSFGTEAAAGGSQALAWSNLRPGTYLIESGSHPSIQGPMGLYGVLVVDDATPADPARPYPGVTVDGDVTALLSEIDPVQNGAVDLAVRTSGFAETKVWNGRPGECGDPAVHNCYPPAVNYDPRYYLINGVSFDRSNPGNTIAPIGTGAASGRILVRFVNAGLRTHVPSVVGKEMALRAEDGFILPGLPAVQSEVLLVAGKTADVTFQPNASGGVYTPASYPVFDRQLSLSTNNKSDGGMQAYINVAGGAAPAPQSAAAHPDSYFVVSGNTLTVADPAKGLLANDVGIYGVNVSGTAPAGLTLYANGTFTYSGPPTSFTYCGNAATAGAACALVTLADCATAAGCLGGAPTANNDSYAGTVATRLQIKPPGVLDNDRDPSGLPLKAVLAGTGTCAGVELNPDGSFIATPSGPGSCAFSYTAVNSQNTASAAAAVTVTFPAPSNLAVNVQDAKTGAPITDYRWIIEEDRTVYIDPSVETTSGTPVRNVAVNFYTSHTPIVAQGCVGAVSCESGQTLLGAPAVCDVGNGACRPGTQKTQVMPGEVYLDPAKRYYISILPGDGSNPIIEGATVGQEGVGHTMGGAQIAAGQSSVNVYLEPTPLQPAKISVYVFQDDNPLNGEADTGGGVDVLAPNEAGLGGFNLVLLDQAGALGDSAGQITYDMFNMPVSNSLAGTIDPATGLDACPIAKNTDRLVGVVPVCPKYESDGTTLSPLAGHAIIDNLYAGLYEVVASPGTDRIARGEEWLQTNTLDGTKAIEAFIKPGEPAYFQEFGPGGYHIAFGFANPKIINARKAAVCANQTCTATINGKVTGLRMSRTPDQRVYSSGSYDMYGFGQCYVSLGAPDSPDFAFAKCNPDGTFQFTGLPKGNMKVTVFDQWNDLLVDGLSTPIKVDGDQIGSPAQPLEIPVTQWRTNLYGRVFIDRNGDNVSQEDEPGLPLVPYNLRARDGSQFGFNNTDLGGYAGFNEIFPILNWLLVDIDSARYKLAGVHVVYDAGGPVDGTTGGGTSTIASAFANTIESPTAQLPTDLRVPGARYCASADCPLGDAGGGSTGRVDPGWVGTEAWQGLLGQNSFMEFAMKPFKAADPVAQTPAENGGIKGIVNYASTRPFDDPALLLQLSWAPNVPGVTVNLYQEGIGPDGSPTLKLVDTTRTTSWDDWAQGFRKNADGTLVAHANGDGTTGYVPNMNCPGQELTSPFYYTLENTNQALDPSTAMAEKSRFKCYDGWSMLNQVQPAPYDGMYKFPSIVNRNPATGAPEGTGTGVDPAGGSLAGTNCTICVPNPDDGTPMLPAGKYVVEIIVPPGYELVKEEDKNILLGDAYVAPVSQQFAGLGNIFIMPDQAAMNASYNPNSPGGLNLTTNLGATPRHEGDTGSVEAFWPCVGEKRIVPDLNSLYPAAGQAAPFAGATRPLCDRKEVILEDQMTVLAKFFVFSSAHIAGHFTGTITNDFASEFDPFSPQYGEKFAVPNTPVAIRDFAGKEISRVYADQWGAYNGLNFSSYTVNPPSPSGYIPQMMIFCMNDPGPILDTRPGSPTNGQMITDPAYNPAYSNFCYEWPLMPGQTAHMDTPVVPTMAFADRYNLPDCAYPDTTPAVASVLGDPIPGGGSGPWVSAAGHPLTINALGDKTVLNHAYSGPRAANTPFNEKFITRHYGFGPRPGTCPTSGACPNVTIAGVPMNNVTTWTDSQIVGNVPALTGAQSTCTVNQRTSPASIGSSARCGQLEIKAANGQKSVDAVTVTIAGKTPSYVTPASPSNNLFGRLEPNPLQTAIDNAAPGDLVIVGPGTFKEMLLMWKPVRLQGVGASSVTINADAHPAGKIDAWRRQVVCLFGLTLDGRPAAGPYAGCPASMFRKVDRNNREAIIGWDVTGNGNLAEQIQEPTLMGAYEGGGITVLGKGVKYPRTADPYAVGTEGAFPAGTRYLNGGADCANAGGGGFDTFDHATSNFRCNPARIDGVSVINSSQGGGGIFAHGWNHSLEVANTRVYANHGTLTGGITIGSGEFTVPYIVGGAEPIPFDYPPNTPNGTQLGYGMNTDVRIHHNAVTSNLSVGDALYSGTNSAAGGVTFCTGSDNYLFNNNWVCGNMSTGDGGGVVHSGFSNDGRIAHNWIIFNQSQSPTIPTNGGGLAILGAGLDRTLTTGPNAGLECGTTNDLDCPPGLGEGTGRNLLVDANLILGNAAESGTGGGLRLQMVNGQDVADFPLGPDRRITGPQALRSPGWNDVTITNNIIADNVAGWDGGGVSMQDALKVRFINNTVIANDTTASAGVLFNTLGAPMAAVPPPGCTPQENPELPQDPSCINPVTTSTNQATGLVTMRNTPNLIAALPANGTGTQVACPAGYGYGSGGALSDGSCREVSLPLLMNNLFWQNRAFHVEVGNLGTGQQNQQAVVTLVPSLNQTATGFCAAAGTDNGAPGSGGPVSYWDIGVRGDSGPADHGSGFTLQPSNSILTSLTGGYGGSGNLAANPDVVRQYCNGSRLPPEGGGLFAGFQAPPGRSETTGLYPVFSLNQITPAATVDEGNNWINLGWGPLSLSNAAIAATAPGSGVLQTPLGDYSITSGSPAIDAGANRTRINGVPLLDFFGTLRPQNDIDIGAVEFTGAGGAAAAGAIPAPARFRLGQGRTGF